MARQAVTASVETTGTSPAFRASSTDSSVPRTVERLRVLVVIREQTLDARGDDTQVGEGDRAFDIVIGLNQQGLALAMSNNGRLRRPTESCSSRHLYRTE